MTDEPSADATSQVCPWCSAALPDPSVVKCPSCGAALKGSVDESLPGLTTIDAGAIVRASQTAIRPKSRLMSWLSGGDDEELFTKAEGNALEPPDPEVKREIFRLELEAEVANLQAENEAIMAEAVAEGRVVDVPPELAEAAGIDLPPATGEAAATEAAPATPDGTEEATAAASDATAGDRAEPDKPA